MKNKFIRSGNFLAICICSFILNQTQAQITGYRVTNTFRIQSSGGWDYIAVGPANNRLYVSHATQVNILNQQTGDSVGVIPNTTGVHGITFVTSLNKGYTSNGKLNNLTIFDLSTNQVLGQIAVGTNPDAIMYDEYSKRIITCNGRSQDLTLIDPVTDKVTGTIPVDGKPETAVSDEKGNIYVNIEDKNEISKIDLNTMKVSKSWSLAPFEGPTGLAIDIGKNKLFAGCDKNLVVLDLSTGKINNISIGDGCDGVAFDSKLGYVFASCGEGKLSIVKEVSPGLYKLVENVQTKPSARTIALDQRSHTVYLPAADLSAAAAEGKRPPMIPGSFQVLVLRQ